MFMLVLMLVSKWEPALNNNTSGKCYCKYRSAVFLIFVVFSSSEDLHERMVNNALGVMVGITTVLVDITKNNSAEDSL